MKIAERNMFWTALLFAAISGIFALTSGLIVLATKRDCVELGVTRARINQIEDSLRVDRSWEALPTEKRLKEIQDALGGLRRAE